MPVPTGSSGARPTKPLYWDFGQMSKCGAGCVANCAPVSRRREPAMDIPLTGRTPKLQNLRRCDSKQRMAAH